MRTEQIKAISNIVLSSFMFAAMAACVKALAALPFMEIVFLRSLLGLIGMLLIMPPAKASFLGKRKKALFLRGLSGACALCLHFYSITRLPLATAIILNQIAPVLIVILSGLFLKERVTMGLAILVITSFLGTMMVIKPDMMFEPIACFAGAASGFLAAISLSAIRYIGKNESSLTSIFYYVLIATVMTAPFGILNFELPSLGEWLNILGVGIFSFIGQIWLTNAFRIGPASMVTPFSYLTSVFSYLLGFFFWNELLTPLANMGALIVVLSGILLSYHAHTLIDKNPLEIQG